VFRRVESVKSPILSLYWPPLDPSETVGEALSQAVEAAATARVEHSDGGDGFVCTYPIAAAREGLCYFPGSQGIYGVEQNPMLLCYLQRINPYQCMVPADLSTQIHVDCMTGLEQSQAGRRVSLNSLKL
jgi:hypothetical protein